MPTEPPLTVTWDEARRLVCAVENCRMSDVFAILKRQPWFIEVRDGVRTTRHLKPQEHIELSKLPKEITKPHLDCIATTGCKTSAQITQIL